MIGIYKIENLINHKCYIGLSKNIEERWKRHKKTAFNSNDKGYNYPIYRAIRKYGIENFSFEVIEECKVSELNQKEKEYIQKYNSFFDGYNQNLGGDCGACSISKEKVLGIITDLETTNLYHKEIAEKWEVSIEMVQGINTGRYWKYDRTYPIQDRYSYLTRQDKKKKEKIYCIDCGKEIVYGALRCEKCAKIFTRKCERPSREILKNMIRTLSFVSIGKQFGVSDNAVRKWCDNYNLPRKKEDIKRYTDEEWLNI